MALRNVLLCLHSERPLCPHQAHSLSFWVESKLCRRPPCLVFLHDTSILVWCERGGGQRDLSVGAVSVYAEFRAVTEGQNGGTDPRWRACSGQ